MCDTLNVYMCEMQIELFLYLRINFQKGDSYSVILFRFRTFKLKSGGCRFQGVSSLCDTNKV